MPVDDHIEEGGPVVRQRASHGARQFTRIFDANTVNPDGPCHLREVGVVERGPEVEQAGRLHLDLDETKGAVVVDDDLRRERPRNLRRQGW